MLINISTNAIALFRCNEYVGIRLRQYESVIKESKENPKPLSEEGTNDSLCTAAKDIAKATNDQYLEIMLALLGGAGIYATVTKKDRDS